MRVLIGEEPSAESALRRAVKALAHECLEVGGQDDLFGLIGNWQPDVIVVDVGLPGLEARELCQKIRQLDGDRGTYLIAVTGSDPSEFRAALEAGADDYMTRPAERNHLEARLLIAKRNAELRMKLAEKSLEFERLHSEVSDDGQRDPLTRVGNRFRLEEDLRALSDRAIRYGHGFSLGLCDVDHFKDYNEKCGREAGDNTLIAVARCLANYGRLGDTAYRAGGQEFIIVLPEAKLEDAERAMDRRRKAIEGLAIPHPAQPGSPNITISVGVAGFDTEADNPIETVLQRAKGALERAKADGRNCVRAHVEGNGE